MQNDLSSYTKSGYLHQDFLLFHLADITHHSFDFHYHEFNKIIFFISGKVTYLIEGKSYQLIPGDILIINNYDIHRPIIDPAMTYERTVLWLHKSFFSKTSPDTTLLADCFKKASQKNYHLLRLQTNEYDKLYNLLLLLKKSCTNKYPNDATLSFALCLEYLVYINRLQETSFAEHSLFHSIPYDHQIEILLKYIQENLANDLNTKLLAEKLFLSRNYLMYKFKKEVGCTIHAYILQKRLLKSLDLLRKNVALSLIPEESGFADYSTFLRAFKKNFLVSPTKWLKKNKEDS